MKKFSTIVVFILLMATTAAAQSGRRAEFFVGYSNLQADRTFDDLGNFNSFRDSFKRNGLNGVEASITGFPVSWLGFTGDFSYHRKSDNVSVGGGTNDYERRVIYFMGGPTLKIRNATRVEPFVHALFGGANVKESYLLSPSSTTGTQIRLEPDQTRFAMALGGGLDVRLGDKFSLRLVQVDYTPIFLGDRVFNVTPNNTIRLDRNRVDNLRISVGVVF